MTLTLTREQIPRARMAVHGLRARAVRTSLPEVEDENELPGWAAWADEGASKEVDLRWADALEAAITEAEGGKDADPEMPQPGPVSDADERAFWRQVFQTVHDDDGRSVATAADQADEALKRYRAAFCARMPSDQKVQP